MVDPARAGRPWRRRRPVALGVTVVVVALVAGGAAAWAVESSGLSGFRTTKVVRASVSNDVALVGTVQPVHNASAAFQVGGKVTTVSATVGENVAVGQTLATLDTAVLGEAVSSDQSTLAASEAKLTEDEDSQTSAAAANATTTTTTAPSHGTVTPKPSGTPGTDTAAITADQNTLTKDEAQTFTDQQQEVADLAQARSACGVGSGSSSPTTSTTTSSSTSTTTSTTTPTTPANTGACTTGLQQVSNDEQQVSTDEATVAKDETSLAKALGDTSNDSSPGGATGGSGTGPGPGGTPGDAPSHALTHGIPSGGNSSPLSGNTGSTGANNSSAASDSLEQIATDQANIDTAQANLIEDQQSLAETTLTSPITGTVASVGISAGDTVSAGSSTQVIVIIGTQSFEVQSTLSSSQAPDVKVGQPADIEVDGESGLDIGTVSQVGPVQSTSAGYSYPVVVTLPASVRGLFAGSTATMTITTGGVRDVMAVPTSSVITNGSTHYVDMLKNGIITRHVVKIGLVGSIYTQVTSGLQVGQSVVLADLAEPVPSSNADTLGGLGGGGFPEGGVFNFQRVRGGPGGPVSVTFGG